MKERFDSLVSCLSVIFAVNVLIYLLFTIRIESWQAATVGIVATAVLFYPFLLTLIPAATGSLAIWLTRKNEHRWKLITGSVLFVSIFPMHLLLLLDAGLYFRYGYHINPHVINIFTTPGGFEGMGMRTGEVVMLACGIGVLALFLAVLIGCFMRFKAWSFLKIRSWKPFPVIAAVAGLIFAVQFFTYAYAHFSMNPAPLLASDSIPLYIKGTSKSLFRKLGFSQPERDAVQIKLDTQVHLDNYPENAISRKPDRKKYNVVWLTCESLAARLFTPEIMPQTFGFAAKGIRFAKHYSGGNVTRQGVFSMFYALPGSYWHAFLAARKGPLFIDWLKEDGYSFKCITSSKFTYPEFDQTVFFEVESEDLHSDSEGFSFERDQRNVKLLLKSIEDGADSGKPFFSFMFFESTHHPYSFPKEMTRFKDYLEPFNAVNTTAADGEAIFKRAANCAWHLDVQLGKVFKLLEEKDLLKNTIVVVAGDHGEEYYEKGRLGHSSVFNEEQTRTPLVIYYPGVKPQVYTKMSSHLDIVPMLAGLFGVENPPVDYSCGMDLLAENSPGRRYSIIANWDQVFFAGEKYKSLIPLDAASFASQTITDADDRELSDVQAFYEEHNADLIAVQHDLTRFVAADREDGSSHAFLIGAGCFLLAAGAVVFGVIIFKRKNAGKC
ncbi:MAG: DUF3413 domain-containing protein [Lentisphaerae bacterium]|nr:DUF3413 domain-containing protein [Lentisphaerota bacterium]